MKKTKLLPHLAAPIARGNQQATLGRLQISAGVSSSFDSFSCVINNCARNAGHCGVQVDGGCVLERCSIPYLKNKYPGTSVEAVLNLIS